MKKKTGTSNETVPSSTKPVAKAIRKKTSSSTASFDTMKLERAREALESLSAVAYDMSEDLLEVEGWLDGLESTLSDLAGFGLDYQPGTLTGFIAHANKRKASKSLFAPIIGAREEVERLIEYASCCSYGIVTIDGDDLEDAGACFQTVWEAVEAVLYKSAKPEG